MLIFLSINKYKNVQLALMQAADRLKPRNGDLSVNGESYESRVQRTEVCPTTQINLTKRSYTPYI